MSNTTTGPQQSQGLAKQLPVFLGPLEQWLDDQIDRRLVRTFFLTLQAIVRFRHSRSGLLLSELGAHVLSPSKAPAGTMRLSNLLRSPRWSHTLLDLFLWHRADQALGQLEETGETALAIWDDSVFQKGITDQNQLANMLFFARHPELAGRRIRLGEKELAKQWQNFRDKIARPTIKDRFTSEILLDESYAATVPEVIEEEIELAEPFVQGIGR